MDETLNVLHHMQDLRKIWKNQDFRYTKDQEVQYEMLLQARRERVASFYENDRVFKGSRIVKEKEAEQEE